MGFKIPTILGLGILVIGAGLGVFLTSQNQIFFTKASSSPEPNNVNIANITDRSVSIFWKTNEESTGFIKSGTSQDNLDKTYLDDRDQKTPQNHRLHFVTLSDLQPETTYYYKIQSGESLYPNNPLSFKTSGKVETFSFEPIAGSVIDKNFEPTKEAIINLELPNAQKLAAITLVAGNFIFPLNNFKTADLTAPLPKPISPIKAKLSIEGTDISSEVTFGFPLEAPSLPPITLGKNIDFSSEIKTSTSSGKSLLYDVNADGVLNAADVSLLFKNFGKVSSNSAKFDLNKDGLINQDDVNLLVVFLK